MVRFYLTGYVVLFASSAIDGDSRFSSNRARLLISGKWAPSAAFLSPVSPSLQSSATSSSTQGNREKTGLSRTRLLDHSPTDDGPNTSAPPPSISSPGATNAAASNPRMTFDSFSENAIKVVMLAQEESRRGGHPFVGTEQLFLGLLAQVSGSASRALRRVGLTLSETRRKLTSLLGRSSSIVSPEIPFTSTAKAALRRVFEEAAQLQQRLPKVRMRGMIDTEHLLLAILHEDRGNIQTLLKSYGVTEEAVVQELMVQVEHRAEKALDGGGEGGESSPSDAPGGPNDSSRLSLNPRNSPSPLSSPLQSHISPSSPLSSSPGKPAHPGGVLSSLREFATDLIEKAVMGRLDPVVGRNREIDRVIQILSRRTKSNPVLIGEPGVGKTAIAEGLATRIVAREGIPTNLLNKRIFALDMGLLVAGTKYRGEFEERLKRIMDDVKRYEHCILVIDEIHTLIGAGSGEGALDAANLLKPALARGEFQCIGATTLDEYKKHFEKDAALERRFQPVLVQEPSLEDTLEILKGLAPKYELFHGLVYSDDALEAAAKYAQQYIADRFLPDKAIDLMDEAGSNLKIASSKIPVAARVLDRELRDNVREQRDIQGAPTVDEEKLKALKEREDLIRQRLSKMLPSWDGMQEHEGTEVPCPTVTSASVAEVVACWTNIPVSRLTVTEAEKMLRLEESLHERVVGQHVAVTAVAKAIRRAKCGMKNPKRPIANFLFCGPTGVGKTELTKALASYLFASDDALIRLDMSEFMEKQSISKLIGSPPGYVGFEDGGQLTEQIRRKPFSVILFDEIEKAHPDVFNILLQLLDDGRLTDSHGRVVSFKNALLIMTSNIGSKIIERTSKGAMSAIGFDTHFMVPAQQQEQLNATLPVEASQPGIAGNATALSTSDSTSPGNLTGQQSNTTSTSTLPAPLNDALYDRMRSLVHDELRRHFRPEFLNRLDETIVFRPLEKSEVERIAVLLLRGVLDRVKSSMEISLEISPHFQRALVDEGYDRVYGARPLRRAITRLVEDSIADAIIKQTLRVGDSALLDLGPDGNPVVTVTSAAGRGSDDTAAAATAADGRSPLVEVAASNGRPLQTQPG